MADITKCKGTGCPWKESCYRYKAPNSMIWQSWFTSVPITWTEDGWNCRFYWALDDKEKREY